MVKRYLLIVLLTFAVGLTFAQTVPRVTKYKVDIWFARNNSTNWCYTLTMQDTKIIIGGVAYNIPNGVNANTSTIYESVSGTLPNMASIVWSGKYTCSGSQSGTRQYTVNVTLTNPDGCGGRYRYDQGVNGGHQIDCQVTLTPMESTLPVFSNTPQCLDQDIVCPLRFEKLDYSGSGTSYYIDVAVWNPATGGVSDVRNVGYLSVPYGTTAPYQADLIFNLKTALGANAGAYLGKQIVFQGRLSGGASPCGSSWNGLPSPWSAPYTLYPEGPKVSGALTSTKPFCTALPNTGAISIPTVSGGTGSYNYSVTRLVPYDPGAGVTCPTRIRINNIDYCPGTSVANATGAGEAKTIAGLNAGLYQVIVENQGGNNPCYYTGYVDIPGPDPFTVSASANAVSIRGYHINCYGGNNGAITVATTNGQSPYTFTINSAAGTPTASPYTFTALTAASYTVSVKDANGCTTDNTLSAMALTQPPDPVTATVNGFTDVTCFGGTNGQVTLQVANVAQPLTYTLNGNAVTPSGGTATEPVFQGLSATVAYTFVVKDNLNCSTSVAPITLVQPAQIQVGAIQPTHVLCYGNPTGVLTVVNATGGVAPLRYSVNDVNYSTNNAIGGLTAGTYTVTIQDANGCKAPQIPVEITQQPQIMMATPSVVDESCVDKLDGIITLTPSTGGTGALEYSVDGLAYRPQTDPVIFGGLKSKSYTVYTRDANDCVVTRPAFVDIRPTITGPISVATPISCFGEADGALDLTPGGGTGTLTFLWSSGETTEDISGKGDGTYFVTITDIKGCSETFDRHLQQPGKLALAPVVTEYHGAGVNCAGSTDGAIALTVNGGTGPFVYAWSNTATTKDVSNLPPGTYSVLVTDKHHCTVEATDLRVIEPAAVGVTVKTLTHILCYDGSTGAIELTPKGGVGDYEYSVNNTNWNAGPVVGGLKAADYTVQMRDANGCTTSVPAKLTQPGDITLLAKGKVDTSCGKANGSAEVEAEGGVADFLYTWYNVKNENVQIAQGATVSSLANGRYKAFATDGNGCQKNITITINDSDGPRITNTLLKELTCYESNDGAIGISIDQGLPPYTVLWDTQETTTDIVNVTGGEHWVEVRDARGCGGMEIYDVPFPAKLALDYTVTQPLCLGDENGNIAIVAFGGNPGGYSYLWDNNETGTLRSDLRAGDYNVTVTDPRGCILGTPITVADPPLFIVDAGGDRTICVGQKLAVRAEEDNATYTWSSSEGFTSDQREVVLSQPATYTLQVVTANGCVGADNFTLKTSDDLLQADFLMAAEAYRGDTVVVVDVSWPLPEGISWVLPTEAIMLVEHEDYAELVFKESGDFNVTINTGLGECLDEYTKTITILGERPVEAGRAPASIVSAFTVSPNPSNGAFTIRATFQEETSGTVRMLSFSGGVALVNREIHHATDFEFAASLQQIPAGLYFIVLEVGNEVRTQRVIIH
ncbi:T9SS type A sorting domain-containing protein [Fulvivirgaceae bacterium PWU5]|uniref:T9SS type A sorting domain-containing protein n=1 Tax=Dawidia cretensis TaxID=2782350 RepID=A0AAP2DZR4_9BACT|nr:T9SS type A sorting domain-containing protein [Dawidia cretensis]MBT1709404.1 T9SS type A sorting domain-containing protein [Dawidia cretensis]